MIWRDVENSLKHFMMVRMFHNGRIKYDRMKGKLKENMRFCADLHGETRLLKSFIEKNTGMERKFLCVLGDAGLNFYKSNGEHELKKELQSLICEKNKNLFLLFVRGNHEMRPENIKEYTETEMFGGKVRVEKEFPNLIFLEDGEIYRIEDKYYLVLGGGYSRDAFSRVINEIGYWSDEELSAEEMRETLERLKEKMPEEIIVLSHMLPEEVAPLSGIEGGKTQKFLQTVLEKYRERVKAWHAGHYHKDIFWQQNHVKFYIHNKISIEM